MKNLNKGFYLLILLAFMGCSPRFKQYAEPAKVWEKEVAELEKRDATETYSDKAILFIGSSSIRLWKNISTDLAPYEPIQRGYGGAKLSDLIFYADRLLKPHQVQAIAVFVANDIAHTPNDKSPEEVLSLYKELVRILRKKAPTQPIFFIEITPTQSRWPSWPKIQEVNRLVKAYSESKKNLHFIETSEAFLANGKPRTELFLGDQLHLNLAGYAIWKEEIKRGLDKVLAK